MQLEWRPYAFCLPRALVTSHGALERCQGWLLRLSGAAGGTGWGEAVALDRRQSAALGGVITALGAGCSRVELERRLPALPAALGFALGAALAECDGLLGVRGGGWLAPPESAQLLPAGAAALRALEDLEPRLAEARPLTLKWKVAACDDQQERQLLEQLLARLPASARLRLDANGGWDRRTAEAWIERLSGEPRLQWLEQPLAPADQAGLEALARRLPVALDESLRQTPELRQRWSGWQVRRPALEGDPRPLLGELQAGAPRRMLSTALETGIGRRLVAHLAALQARGPTPVAPGLAPGWRPAGALSASDPERVWQAAAAGEQP
ncbi:MAG: o-succinylbenzoate synthase [Synechococcaceae cyanobacterium]|nr:o-succinylbenzoate synthase [Synechococcaceae cyanobacterium]